VVDKEDMIHDAAADREEFRQSIDFQDIDLGEEDVAYENLELDDFDSLSDEDDPPLKRSLRRLRKDRRKKHMRDGIASPFYVGQAFSNRKEISDLVKDHAVATRRQLKTVKNESTRFRVVCIGQSPNFEGTGENSQQVDGSSEVGGITSQNNESPTTCPWVLHVSNPKKLGTWVVTTFKDVHVCLQTRKVDKCNISFIVKNVMDILIVNPTIPVRSLQELLQKKLQVEVSENQVYRAKDIAMKAINGYFHKQYENLNSYAEELIRSNAGTTIKIDVDQDLNPNSTSRQFKRIYICLGALKRGFKLCGRDILGIDGCFIKGLYPGQILTAVGLDSNNSIYPVAYSIVESECKESWVWFLEHLGDDLVLDFNSNFTFISDWQKVLLNVLFNCLHLHTNYNS